jgi:hypothetical protein
MLHLCMRFTMSPGNIGRIYILIIIMLLGLVRSGLSLAWYR